MELNWDLEQLIKSGNAQSHIDQTKTLLREFETAVAQLSPGSQRKDLEYVDQLHRQAAAAVDALFKGYAQVGILGTSDAETPLLGAEHGPLSGRLAAVNEQYLSRAEELREELFDPVMQSILARRKKNQAQRKDASGLEEIEAEKARLQGLVPSVRQKYQLIDGEDDISAKEIERLQKSGKLSDRSKAQRIKTQAAERVIDDFSELYAQIIATEKAKARAFGEDPVYARLERVHGISPKLLEAIQEGRDFSAFEALAAVKAKAARTERLHVRDKFLQLADQSIDLSLEETINLVGEAFEKISPLLARTFKEVREQGRINIHSKTRATGTYCLAAPHGAFADISFSGSLESAMVVASEIAHTVHAYLSRDLHARAATPRSILYKAVGILCEQAFLDTLMGSTSEPTVHKEVLVNRIERARTFLEEQAVFSEFELSVFAHKEGLNKEDLKKYWGAARREVTPYMELGDGQAGYIQFGPLILNPLSSVMYEASQAVGQSLTRLWQEGELRPESINQLVKSGSRASVEDLLGQVGIEVSPELIHESYKHLERAVSKLK